jgi:hypothetical protein
VLILYICFAGFTLEKIFVFYLVVILFVITITLFAFLYEIRRNEFTSYRIIIMGSTLLFFVVALYNVCDEGHYISNVVRFYS